ncbi:Shoulder domain protein [Bernardetia litoralis DSM 6794]|uniref:Shoulder domain protein n=1 Tax=Bernardetia litoralis (strain ATCC 23117 / DSM 6794 / NBRC 15988 / NCIMB 1366 / Fx l1 / Sio-4) TaxID=880071 RepID=I4AHY9_BERLS|nr:Shoulder domain protein [Bernardetia litoralis]AFM03574.1 Shoulder domain protein [Bernardetia litoralis DSM 6794]
MSDVNRERDLVLAPNEYAFISDQTKGHINVYVGPYKTSLANTDRPVMFDDATKRFEKCNLEEAMRAFVIAPEGWYIVLKNPSKDTNPPKIGTSNNLVELNVGRKVNIAGPISFALWAGQMARVIRGHNLSSNQYLLVRVYDEQQARENWGKSVIKTKEGEISEAKELNEVAENLTMGQLLIIRGDEVSFYIPPTGIEVVRDEDAEDDEYVREAVTLERLEYCILLNEDGNKRYIQGPKVVFPKPTEVFIQKKGMRKFKAIELNEMSGLYIKVIAPYKEGKNEYKEGDELFITGKNQMIYYPRPEHAVVRYGNQERHYAIAIPAGEGRYYLNRKTGTVALMKGAAMFLPDPREFVLVRRVLSKKQTSLWFPNNNEAMEYNLALQDIAKNDNFVTDFELQEQNQAPKQFQQLRKKRKISDEMVGDEFNRDSSFTPPRTITLDTKFEGAVTISPWTGYAVLVVSKTGKRKVIEGPQSYLLEYDEELEGIELSTGTPKTTENSIKTVYLRVLYNKVSDEIMAESADYTQVRINLSYRVNFEGSSDKWFNVENYVKFLTDHMRSYIRNTVKKYPIMEFYANGITILRDAILGESEKKSGKRTGRLFEENGMRIYDVEVLDISLGDANIENLLISSQQDTVMQTLRINSEKRKLEFTQENEAITRQIAATQSETKQKIYDLQKQETQKLLEVTLSKIESEIISKERHLQAKLDEQKSLNQINDDELSRQKAINNLELEKAQKQLEQFILEEQTEVEAVVAKAKAVSPDLIAALQSFSDKELAQKMADSMAPLAILGGKSIADVFGNLLKGTQLSSVLSSLKLPENTEE